LAPVGARSESGPGVSQDGVTAAVIAGVARSVRVVFRPLRPPLGGQGRDALVSGWLMLGGVGAALWHGGLVMNAAGAALARTQAGVPNGRRRGGVGVQDDQLLSRWLWSRLRRSPEQFLQPLPARLLHGIGRSQLHPPPDLSDGHDVFDGGSFHLDLEASADAGVCSTRPDP